MDWNHARVARASDLERALAGAPAAPAGPPEARAARRLLAVLQALHTMRGTLDLENLAGARPAELRRFLAEVPLLDRAEIDPILLVAFRSPVMPVDDGVLRVCQRHRLVEANANRAEAQRLLEASLDPGRYYAAWKLLAEHAERVCLGTAPRCKECAVAGSCRSAGKVK